MSIGYVISIYTWSDDAINIIFFIYQPILTLKSWFSLPAKGKLELELRLPGIQYMSVLANEIFLSVAGILVGSVDAHVFSDVSFTEDSKGRALIHHLCWQQINSTTQ